MTSGQETALPIQPKSSKFPAWVRQANYRVVSKDNLREAMQELVDADKVAWDTEFIPTHASQILIAVSFSTQMNSGWMIPVRMRHMENLPLDIVQKFIYAFSKKRNITQNSRAERASVQDAWPTEWANILNITDDIQVLWYLKDPNEAKDFKESRPARRGSAQPQGFSLEAMALKYLKLETPSLGDFFKKGGTFDYLDGETARLYSCSDADVTLRLFEKGMDQAMSDSFIYRLEMQLLPILHEMERRGMWFDKKELAEIERQAKAFVDETREEAYEKLGLNKNININSHQKLAEHIYNVLAWPLVGRKGKRGLGSVDKNAIARFVESADPAIADAAKALQQYKMWFTLHNNFLSRLHEYVNPHTESIHCSFLSTVVPTGRLACASPNMQQIPQRNPKAPLRRAFPSRPGYYFFEADYSQIELRVYAGESKEPYFFEAFEKGTDLHLQTASIIFRDKITDKEDPRRQMGKTMNFGPIYGMKPEGLAMRTDYSLAEAERILDDFFAAIPQAVKWTNDVYIKARNAGGVHTHFGRWRPLPWITSRIPHEREFGERSAVNTIVQGTAADIMKMGLVRLQKMLAKSDIDARMVLTVHDSVMLEVSEKVDIAEFYQFAEEALCFKIPDYPPLGIDAKIGPNWHDMEPYKPGGKVEIDTADPVEKEVTIPQLTQEQESQFLTMVSSARSEAGELKVHFARDGKKFGPFQMTGESYRQILGYVVEAARLNKVAEQRNGQPKDQSVPRVEFV